MEVLPADQVRVTDFLSRGKDDPVFDLQVGGRDTQLLRSAIDQDAARLCRRAPQQALEGFLRKTGLAQDELEERDGIWFAVTEKPGRAVKDVLAEAIPAIIHAFPWPKSMRWGTGPMRWVRSLQRILCLFDGAVVSAADETKPAAPKPRVVTTVADAIASASSWYTYCPNNLALADAEQMGLRKVCFVGVPCQITPTRKIQLADPRFLDNGRKKEKHIERQTKFLKGFGDIVSFTVGLLCTEVFTYEGLMVQKIEGEMGIPLAEVKKFNVKGKVLIYKTSGELVEMNLHRAQEYARPECHHCGDFTAELAYCSRVTRGL